MTQLAKIQTCNYDSIVRKHQKFSSKVRVYFYQKYRVRVVVAVIARAV